MRTTPILRPLAAALLAGGTLAVSAAGTTAAAAPPTYAEGHDDGYVRGTVVVGVEVSLRQQPSTLSAVAGLLDPGSQDHVQCTVRGQSVNGNPYWYWLTGAQAWASAAYVDTGSAAVPTCADPCPEWKDGWRNADWSDPDWHEAWALSVTVVYSGRGSAT
jgi:hypothetical protein